MSDSTISGAPNTGTNFQDFQTDPTLGQTIQPNVPPQTSQPNPNFSQPQAPNPWVTLSKLGPSHELSQDGKDYVKILLDTILSDQFLVKGLSAVYLNVPQQSLLITHGHNVGFLILFEETLNTIVDDQLTQYYSVQTHNFLRNLPISRLAITAAIKTLMQMGYNIQDINSFNLLGIEIIRPSDYKRVSKLTDRIKSAFMLNGMTATPFASPIQYPSLLDQASVNIFSDIKDVHNSINTISTHGIQPRVDIGCRIIINYPVQQSFGVNKASCEIGSIGGYVQFIEDLSTNIYTPQAVSPKYTPLIHITDISTAFPTPSLLAILLTTFYETFCVNRQYQKAYYDLTIDTTNIRNIQYLFPMDAEGRTIPGLDTIEGRQAILNSPHFNPPLLVLDVTEGNYCLSSIQHNDFASVNNLIKYHLCSALNMPYLYNDIFDKQWEEYTGFLASANGGLVDSRYCSDFLSTVDAIKDYNRARGLLSIYQNPQDKVNLLKSIYAENLVINSVTSIYKINIAWLVEIRNIIRPYMHLDMNQVSMYEGAQILDLSADISNYTQQYNNIHNAFAPLQQNRSQYGNISGYNYNPHIQPMQQPAVSPNYGAPLFQSPL
jgi:hypothetical protein